MREQVLRDFFKGKATAVELSADIAGSTRHVASIVSYQQIEDMDSEFIVTRPMLIALCDAVLTGGLLPESLHEIGFALVSSDHFLWDTDHDELVTEIINDWACPEVNYSLTIENVRRFKSWLRNDEPYPFQKLTLGKTLDRVISIRHKRSTK